MFERDMGENGELSFDDARAASQRLVSNVEGAAQGSLNDPATDVIMGVDPSLLQAKGESSAQEMKELGGMRFAMMAGDGHTSKLNTSDSMDLDEVLEDQRIAQPSSATKRVDFAE